MVEMTLHTNYFDNNSTEVFNYPLLGSLEYLPVEIFYSTYLFPKVFSCQFSWNSNDWFSRKRYSITHCKEMVKPPNEASHWAGGWLILRRLGTLLFIRGQDSDVSNIMSIKIHVYYLLLCHSSATATFMRSCLLSTSLRESSALNWIPNPAAWSICSTFSPNTISGREGSSSSEEILWE